MSRSFNDLYVGGRWWPIDGSFDDYNPLTGDLQDEENAALAALENIADDIFTAATSNW